MALAKITSLSGADAGISFKLGDVGVGARTIPLHIDATVSHVTIYANMAGSSVTTLNCLMQGGVNQVCEIKFIVSRISVADTGGFIVLVNGATGVSIGGTSHFHNASYQHTFVARKIAGSYTLYLQQIQDDYRPRFPKKNFYSWHVSDVMYSSRPAVGFISNISVLSEPTLPSDGQYFWISGYNDSTGTFSQYFEFDTGGGVGGGNATIDITGLTKMSEVLVAIKTAIDGALGSHLDCSVDSGSIRLATKSAGETNNITVDMGTAAALGWTWTWEHDGMTATGGYGAGGATIALPYADGVDTSLITAIRVECRKGFSGDLVIADPSSGTSTKLSNGSDNTTYSFNVDFGRTDARFSSLAMGQFWTSADRYIYCWYDSASQFPGYVTVHIEGTSQNPIS